MTDEKTIEAIVEKAVIYDLDGCDRIAEKPTSALAETYNGVGPAWWPEKFRAKATKYCKLIEPAIMIHDDDFEHADATRKSFYEANYRLRDNIRKIANYVYTPVLSLKWWELQAVAKVFSDACNDYGWLAWQQGSAK